MSCTWPAGWSPGRPTGADTHRAGLHRLPPAHTLTLQEGRPRIDQYWRLEDVPLLHLGKPQDYVDAFLPLYEHAVRERLRSVKEVGVTLSGGFDSGSVTSLAARALREQGMRLRAYTSVPIYDVSGTAEPNQFGDELPFAQAVASFAGNVDLVEIRTTSVTPIQAIRHGIDIHREPGHAAGNAYWITDLLETARRDGLGVILSGQGGNATISWTGMSSARRIGRLASTGHWKAFIKRFAYPILTPEFVRRLRHVLHRDSLDWSHTAIHPDFARQLGLAYRYIEGSGTITNPEEWLPPIQHRYAIIKPGESFLGATWAENSAAHGLDVRIPPLMSASWSSLSPSRIAFSLGRMELIAGSSAGYEWPHAGRGSAKPAPRSAGSRSWLPSAELRLRGGGRARGDRSLGPGSAVRVPAAHALGLGCPASECRCTVHAPIGDNSSRVVSWQASSSRTSKV